MSDDAGILLKLVILDRTPGHTADYDWRALMDTSKEAPALPQVTIPRSTRLAYSATVAAREKYGLELFGILSVQVKPEDKDSIEIDGMVLVCRLQDPAAALPKRFAWSNPLQAQPGDADRIALDAATKEFVLYDSGEKASSFGRYSSLDDLRAWYKPYLAQLGVRETGIQQWNGDPWFALFRIETAPHTTPQSESQATPAAGNASGLPEALWCKAVGEPNTREFAVTEALTKECPYWFPKLIATKPEWHAWLMEGVNGHELDEELDGRPWALTARILAKVQKRFVGREEDLLALGCRDWRIPRVLESLDAFFADIEERMERQLDEPPHRLGSSELRELKLRCRDLCHRVEDVDIPYTIAHGDFSPHNVIVSNGWPVLIDWAEAYVSFPFISWEYFWNRTIKDHPEHSQWRERMHRNYAYRVWEPLLTRRRVDEGLRLSPAMAVLVLSLYGIDEPEERENRRADPTKRSLVRRLHRELKLLQQQNTEPVGAL